MSRAVYEGRAKVEGIEGILVRNYQEALAVLEENKIAVIVDRKPRSARISPGSTCGCHPCKEKYGDQTDGCTVCDRSRSGIYCGKDVHAVIETMRGETLADIIYDGQPIPNTGVLDMWAVMRWSA